MNGPTYPRGLRALAGAIWQRLRHGTWRAYAPADDHGFEPTHPECAGPGPRPFDRERPWG